MRLLGDRTVSEALLIERSAFSCSTVVVESGGEWPALRAGRRGDQHSVPRLPPLSVHAHVFTGGTLKPIPDNWHLTRVPESLLKHTDVFTKR